MMTTCPDCRYAQQERAGIHMTHAGLSVEAADALAAGERCGKCRTDHGATEAKQQLRPTNELNITVRRWEKFGANAGEFVGGQRTLAGPFRFGFDGSREVVIGKYRKWLHEEIKARGQVWGKLRDLLPVARSGPGLVLVCMEPEFGEVIARALRWMDSTEGNKENEARKDSAA